jgi:hypothetical protein
MSTLRAVLPYLIGLSLIAVAASLGAGLVSMARGGDFATRWGNRLMRLRIASQAVAVALVALYFLITRFG